MKKLALRIAILLALGALVLSACGSPATPAAPTETIDISALSTSVAQTVIAQITEQAPTITDTPTITKTPLLTPTSSTPQPTNTSAQPTPAGCANMTFVTDVTIPDETQLAIGSSFTKTWRVKNSGTCQWTTGFKLAFSYGEQMGGKAVAMPSVVEVGQTIDLSVDLKVPNKASKLTGVWRLWDDKNQPFGPYLTVVIIAGNATATPTSTLTPTLENTATPTATPTQ
jgi:hypothetical protein